MFSLALYSTVNEILLELNKTINYVDISSALYDGGNFLSETTNEQIILSEVILYLLAQVLSWGCF